MTTPHILVLGGTGEARTLAERLAARGDLRITLSLAGRTERPLPQAGETKMGGFGGVEGLAAWMAQNAVDMLVDATHPYAARISANAEAAARLAGVPLVALERAPWTRAEGDRWIAARDIAHAAQLTGATPRTVFLSIGRQELEPFRGQPHRFVVRSIDEPALEQTLPGARLILARGPFDEDSERQLLQAEGVELVVAKNSGGEATYGKVAAARALGLPVIMVARPRPPADGAVWSVEEALARITHLAGLPAERGE